MRVWLGIIAGLVVVVLVVAFVFLYHPGIDPITPPQRAAFDQAQINKGAVLAELGDCAVCHTAANGQPYAGGLPVPTPFGTIYSTNITPDPDSGIGRWSEVAFARAMSDGVSRDGHLLYPAFPYDHFTHVNDDDVKALYAFVMTRQPVAATPPANQLRFPYNIRLLMAGWNFLFLHRGPIAQDPNQSAAWNRGAYLVDGLGHCGACHTPRNSFGAEDASQAFAGGDAEGWNAPALNSASVAPVPWTVDTMTTYLRKGWVDQHSASSGPMQSVYHNLGDVDVADVQAIATYVVALAGPPTPQQQQRATQALALAEHPPVPAGDSSDLGASVFSGTCDTCHRNGGPTLAGHLPMALYTAVNSPDPRNFIQVVLNGLRPIDGEAGPLMPAFGSTLTDAQITALAGYVRSNFTKDPAWTGIADTVQKIRQGQT